MASIKTKTNKSKEFPSGIGTLRKAIGVDLSSKLKNEDISYAGLGELDWLNPSIKAKKLMKDNLKYSVGQNFIEGFQKYLQKNTPSYLKSAEFPNYVDSFRKGKTSFYSADKLRSDPVRDLVSKYVPIKNETQEAFDGFSSNNKGLIILDYYFDDLPFDLMNSLDGTNEDFKPVLSFEKSRKNLDVSTVSPKIKKAIFNSVLSQIKYDNLVNEAFSKALKSSKGEDRRKFVSYFKYHNTSLLKTKTMEDLSGIAKDYFDKTFS